MKLLITAILLAVSVTVSAQQQYEFNYEYYHEKAKKAKRHRNRGISFTAVGVGFLGLMTGVAIGVDKDEPARAPVIWLTGGIGTINLLIGVPLWIAGDRNYKKNKKAMEALDPSLSLEPTQNGVGLVLRL